MALTKGFKRSMKDRRQRSRRMEVVAFGILMMLGLINGTWPWGLSNFGTHLIPYVLVLVRIYILWDSQRVIKVSSLDDRAMLEYGVIFDALGQKEQQDILRRYQVGTFLMGSLQDEREETLVRESCVHAYEVLRWLLPLLAVVYWVGWRLLPEGGLRAGWTNGPVVMTWVSLLVVAFPQLYRLWTEPDEVGEPREVASAVGR